MIEIDPCRLNKIIIQLQETANERDAVANARLTAAIFFKGSIIATGGNQRKSHPFQLKYARNEDSIFLHAETDAIKNSLRFIDIDDLKKSALIVCRVKANGTLALAKPCDGCQRAIANFNIQHVYYTTNEGEVKYL